MSNRITSVDQDTTVAKMRELEMGAKAGSYRFRKGVDKTVSRSHWTLASGDAQGKRTAKPAPTQSSVE